LARVGEAAAVILKISNTVPVSVPFANAHRACLNDRLDLASRESATVDARFIDETVEIPGGEPQIGLIISNP